MQKSIVAWAVILRLLRSALLGRCNLALEAQAIVRSMDQAGSTNTEFGDRKGQVGTT